MAKTRREQLFEQLKEEQRNTIYLLLEREQYGKNDENRMSLDDIADAVGVTRKTIYSWRTQNAIFQEALSETSREMLAALAPQAFGAMARLLGGKQPSTKALDLYYKAAGWIKNEQKIDITTNGRNDADLEAELARLKGATGVGDKK